MQDPEPADLTDLVSVGAFSPPDADRLLKEIVSAGIRPVIKVDDGIRRVDEYYGSAGLMAKVEVFVPRASVEKACAMRDGKLGLTGEV